MLPWGKWKDRVRPEIALQAEWHAHESESRTAIPAIDVVPVCLNFWKLQESKPSLAGSFVGHRGRPDEFLDF